MRRRLRCLFFGICLTFFVMAGVQASAVVIVTSEPTAPMLETIQTLVEELERAGVPRNDIVQMSLAELARARFSTAKLFVALGSEAANLMAKTEWPAPVLCVLLPRHSFERALLAAGRKASPQFSGIYLDQPWARQLDLVNLALPSARRVGVLWGPDSQGQSAALKAAAQARGLEVVDPIGVPADSVFAGLKQVLEGTDLLLAVADPQVYNSNSIQNILLTSLRARVPLVAFSPAYVKAGALLSLHVTPTQIGRQAATMVRASLQGRALPATPVYSQEFSVAVNEHVARSLGLTLDALVLAERLRRKEGGP